MFFSLPSPSSSELVFGGFHLRFYGLMIALGVFAAVELSRRRWARTGGNPEDITSLALWTVPAGLIGARFYHVLTDWKTYEGHWIDALKIQNGGLGIPGGIAFGLGVGVFVARKKGMHLPTLLDVAAPAVPLAQAIGRFGNWFNQELFGSPTNLPWGLQIDVANRPYGYENVATYHPTFLYEALWNIALCLFLLWIGRKKILNPGNLFVLYLGGYFLGRLWVESLRIDHASLILGLRVNTWLSLILIIGSLVILGIRGLFPKVSHPEHIDNEGNNESNNSDDKSDLILDS